MIIAYLAALILSLVFGSVVLAMGRKINITSYALMYLCVTVACFGYFITASSSDIKIAMTGNIFAYFGILYTMLFMVLSFSRITGLTIKSIIYVIMNIFNMVVVFFVSTAGINEYYYKGIYITSQYGAYSIGKESYGPAHMLHYLLLATYVAFSIYFIAYSLTHRRIASYKNVLFLAGIEISVIVVYLIELIFDNIQLELIPFGMVVGELIGIFAIRRLAVYDITSRAESLISIDDKDGYLIIDKDMRFIACDNTAVDFFPEFGNLIIDKDITLQLTWVADMISKVKNDTSYMTYKITDDKREIRCVVTRMLERERNEGYIIEFLDETDSRKYISLLNSYNTKLKHEVEEQVGRLEALQEQTILGMATMVESRDRSTGSHIRRTSACVKILADHLKKESEYRDYPEEFWRYVVNAAPLHDLGKIAVDDQILRKPGKYEAWEYEIMKSHAEKGASIVAEVLKAVPDREYAHVAENIAHFHHEKWSGEGYPDGLKGRQIPFEARIMAVADVFDALVSKRCYKEPFSMSQAIDIIRDSFGSHFDPGLANVFEASIRELEAFYASEFARSTIE